MPTPVSFVRRACQQFINIDGDLEVLQYSGIVLADMAKQEAKEHTLLETFESKKSVRSFRVKAADSIYPPIFSPTRTGFTSESLMCCYPLIQDYIGIAVVNFGIVDTSQSFV